MISAKALTHLRADDKTCGGSRGLGLLASVNCSAAFVHVRIPGLQCAPGNAVAVTLTANASGGVATGRRVRRL